MTAKTIAIAADHGGVELKSQIIKSLAGNGWEVLDLGTDGSTSVDYPDYAQAVANRLSMARLNAVFLYAVPGSV